MQADEEHAVEASHWRRVREADIEGEGTETDEIGGAGVYLDEMLAEALSEEYGGNIGTAVTEG